MLSKVSRIALLERRVFITKDPLVVLSAAP